MTPHPESSFPCNLCLSILLAIFQKQFHNAASPAMRGMRYVTTNAVDLWIMYYYLHTLEFNGYGSKVLHVSL